MLQYEPLDTVRWGILGCGDVCEHKSGPPLYQTDGSELVAVMRRDGAKAADFAKRHGVPSHYDKVEGLLADPEVNAIYIASPPHVHRAHAEAVASAGKHILLEKPMANTEEDAQAINAAAAENGVQLMVAYYRRYFPVVRQIKAWLDAGVIGQPLRARAHHTGMYVPPADGGIPWRAAHDIAGGGFMADAGIHRFDLFHFFFGPVANVRALTETLVFDLEVDDTSTILVRHESGVHATAAFNWNVGVNLDEFEITGTEGRILSRNLGKGELELTNDKGPQSLTLPAPKYVHAALIEHFVDCLRAGKPNTLPGTVGIEATRMVLAAYKASSTGSTIPL